MANIGERKLSVLGCQISQLGSGPINQIFYDGIDGGFYRSDGMEAKLPISLDSGESAVLVAYVGVRVPNEVHSVLSRLGESVDMARARIELGRRGLDLYGNHIEFSEGVRGGHITVDPAQQRAPIIVLDCNTSRRTRTVTLGSDYLDVSRT